MRPRFGAATAIAISVTLTLAAPAFAFFTQGVSPATQALVMQSNANPAANHEDGHPACTGIANAFAHVSANQQRNGNEGRALEALLKVADMLGCDLAVGETTNTNDTDEDADADEPVDLVEGGGPPDWVVARKCDKIAEKLAVAQERPHGKSAEAFARQAERWDCPTD
jgi:hypothetical protein